MILGRLLTALFEGGVVFVMTSNYRPDDLYPNGLQRQQSLPTIALLKQRLDVVEVDGGIDYRLRALEHGVRLHCAQRGARRRRAATRCSSACGPAPTKTPSWSSRRAPSGAKRRAGSVVWFDFATLCDGPRSQLDYLELARRFAVVIVSDVPRLTADMGNAARRFTWLVDVLYDHRVKLLLSAAVPAEELYRGGSEQPGVSAHGQPADRDAHARIHGVAAPDGRRRTTT